MLVASHAGRLHVRTRRRAAAAGPLVVQAQHGAQHGGVGGLRVLMHRVLVHREDRHSSGRRRGHLWVVKLAGVPKGASAGAGAEGERAGQRSAVGPRSAGQPPLVVTQGGAHAGGLSELGRWGDEELATTRCGPSLGPPALLAAATETCTVGKSAAPALACSASGRSCTRAPPAAGAGPAS